ncbi:unnamed protein product [Penicillium discolor]
MQRIIPQLEGRLAAFVVAGMKESHPRTCITFSLLVMISRPGNFDNLAGTEVRLDHPSTLPAKTFVLDEKLSEEYQTMTQLECDQGLGPPFAAIKFSCHNLLNPAHQGFMRIYRQIPIDGTISSPPEVRAQQAVSQHTHAEIKVLKTLDD